MKQVSVAGEDLFAQLVAWELLGDHEVDPKSILRSVAYEDLQTVATNISGDRKLKEFLVAKMVEVELMFREQLLAGDWQVCRSDNRATLSYTPFIAPPRPSLTVHTAGDLA